MREYETREIIRITGNNVSEIDEPIVDETCVILKLNGAEAARFFCTPSSLEHLAVGWLRTKGKIISVADVEDLSVDLGSKTVFATVNKRHSPQGVTPDPGPKSEPSPESDPSAKPGLAKKSGPSGEAIIPASLIEPLFNAFNASSQLFHKTGGAHSCAVIPVGSLIGFDGVFPVISEDVGRHNAVLKAIGGALASGIDADNAIMLFSGRLALEIVDTAAGLRFPIVLSAGAPTTAAVDSAEENGVTLAGFIKPGKINIYTHPQRIDRAL